MKKSFIIAAIAGLSLVSCKKEYTCTCTYSGTTQQGKVSEIIKDTKKGAKATCESYNEPDPAIAGVCELE